FDGEYLLPEFKHLDFLWLMKGDVISEETVQAMIQSVRQINGVQLVMELSQDKIKNKGHLIF
ncbi:MAG: IPExxxVDY family protein, partial [Chitinophagaceae bacterium]